MIQRPPGEEEAPAPRGRRFGLRFYLVVALSLAFVLSSVLLGLAAVQLGERARHDSRLDHMEALATVFSKAMEERFERGRFTELADTLMARGGVAGVELDFAFREDWARGMVGHGEMVEAPCGEGDLRLWLRPPREAVAFSRLLIFYAAFTGGVIVLLTFLALTVLLVRPIELVTRASARVAAGHLDVKLVPRGAKEVAELAQSFNGMAQQLREDRSVLEERLAELEATTAELESAQQEVLRSERLASVGRLSAGVAHEIGNPLAAIAGLVEVARDEDLDADERDEFLGRIQSETERIHKIIRELLDFARTPDEDAAEEADLVEVIEDAVRLVLPQHDSARLRIERRLEAVGRVPGSADRWTQVVLNLLLNAVDAVDGEGEIIIELREEEGTVFFACSDSGPGIAEEVLEHLFEPFVTTKSSGKGTGLGLAVCQRIVDGVGGTLEAENAPEGGARFCVEVPLASVRAARRSVVPPRNASDESA